MVSDFPDWSPEPRDLDAEIEEWWAWHLESEREPQTAEPDEGRRVVSIDPGEYL